MLIALLACAPATAGEAKTATLDVPGMFCSLCQISVRKVLERLPGVLDATADSKAKRAEVTYDPSKVSAEELAAALTNSGFAATVRSQ